MNKQLHADTNSSGRALEYNREATEAVAQWLTPIIPATWEAEIGKILVQDWPQTKTQDLISKNNVKKNN
jgi:hypothetical protein